MVLDHNVLIPLGLVFLRQRSEWVEIPICVPACWSVDRDQYRGNLWIGRGRRTGPVLEGGVHDEENAEIWPLDTEGDSLGLGLQGSSSSASKSEYIGAFLRELVRVTGSWIPSVQGLTVGVCKDI